MLPPTIQAELQSEFGRIEAVTRVAGGDVNQAAQVSTATDRYFIKWNQNYLPNLFAAEASGLELLDRTQQILVPPVKLVGKNFLVLE